VCGLSVYACVRVCVCVDPSLPPVEPPHAHAAATTVVQPALVPAPSPRGRAAAADGAAAVTTVATPPLRSTQAVAAAADRTCHIWHRRQVL
jgi:hypothetical protein